MAQNGPPGARGGDAFDPTPVEMQRQVPRGMLWRVSGALNQLLACGIVRQVEDGTLELRVSAEEAARGGMVSISMYVPVRCAACSGREEAPCSHCQGRRTTDALFSAWLTVFAGETDGALLTPSVPLPGMVHPVMFRLRVSARS